jgi:hypothetical protein
MIIRQKDGGKMIVMKKEKKKGQNAVRIVNKPQ